MPLLITLKVDLKPIKNNGTIEIGISDGTLKANTIRKARFNFRK